MTSFQRSYKRIHINKTIFNEHTTSGTYVISLSDFNLLRALFNDGFNQLDLDARVAALGQLIVRGNFDGLLLVVLDDDLRLELLVVHLLEDARGLLEVAETFVLDLDTAVRAQEDGEALRGVHVLTILIRKDCSFGAKRVTLTFMVDLETKLPSMKMFKSPGKKG